MLNPVGDISGLIFYLFILIISYFVGFIRAIVIHKIHGLQAVLTITLLAVLTFSFFHFIHMLDDEIILKVGVAFTLIIIFIPLKLIPSKVVAICFVVAILINLYFEFSFKKKLENYLLAQSIISYETISLYTWAENVKDYTEWERIYKRYPDPKVIVEGLNCYFYSTLNAIDKNIYTNTSFRNATFSAWSEYAKTRKEKIDFQTAEYVNTSYYLLNGNGDAALQVSLKKEFMFWWIELAKDDVIMQSHIEVFFNAIENECLSHIFAGKNYRLEELSTTYLIYVDKIKDFNYADRITLSIKKAIANATAKELEDKAEEDNEDVSESSEEDAE